MNVKYERHIDVIFGRDADILSLSLLVLNVYKSYKFVERQISTSVGRVPFDKTIFSSRVDVISKRRLNFQN